MESSQHEEPIDVEEAAFNAGFNDTDIVPEDQPKVEEPEAKPEAAVVEPEPEKPLTRAELQALIAKTEELEARVAKNHDKAAGKLGELQQRIEQARSMSRGISPKARQRLEAEFPELASMLFEGADEEQVELPKQVNVEELVASKLEEKHTAYQREVEKRLLTRDHKDWQETVSSDDFKKWVGALPPADREQLSSTWDADFVSAKLTDYKAWKTAQEKTEALETKATDEKTKRLEAALQPRGVPRGQSSYIEDDEEAAMEKAFSG